MELKPAAVNSHRYSAGTHAFAPHARGKHLHFANVSCGPVGGKSLARSHGPAVMGPEVSCRKLLAAARTPRRDHFAAPNGRHPGTKPVPALAHKLAWLICPLHCAAPLPVTSSTLLRRTRNLGQAGTGVYTPTGGGKLPLPEPIKTREKFRLCLKAGSLYE